MEIENTEQPSELTTDDYTVFLREGVWVSFVGSIPEAQAHILTKGLYLTLISYPDSLLPVQITELLTDEHLTLSNKKLELYEAITNNIITLLPQLGFKLNDDQATHVRLQDLCALGEFVYELDGYEDLIGLGGLLSASDVSPVDRFLNACARYFGDDSLIERFADLLEDISEVTLKAIQNNFANAEPDVEALPESLIKRIRDNRDLIAGTLAHSHIVGNGQPGGSVESFLSFFSYELGILLDNPNTDNLKHYGKEIVALYLISEVNTDRLVDEVMKFLTPVVTDHLAFNEIETFIGKLKLHD